MHSKAVHAIAGQNFAAPVAAIKRLDPSQTSQLTVAISWGDGSVIDTSSVVDRVSLALSDKHPTLAHVLGSHTYQSDGIYKVIVSLSVDSKIIRSTRMNIHVHGAPPVKTGRAFKKTLGTVLAGAIPGVGADQSQQLSIEWGDGLYGTDDGTPTVVNKDGIDLIEAAHQYAKPGTYVVEIRVTTSSNSPQPQSDGLIYYPGSLTFTSSLYVTTIHVTRG
jgi:hypothetical protein